MVKKKIQKSRLAGTLGVLGALFIFSGVSVSAQYQIQDDAQLFTAAEVQQIENKAEEIDEQYQMNVFVMTCEDAKGKESREVLEDTYESYGLEKNDARGGIALIIDMDNRELNLVTERDMMYYITDYREEEIYDAGWEYVTDGEYGEAMLAMLDVVIDDLEAGIPGNQYTYDTETGKIVRYRSLTTSDVLLAFAAAMLLSGITVFILYRNYTVVKKYKYSTQKNANIQITGQQDRLINQFVTHRKIENDPPSSGGDRGRTSTHQSSGGTTYGGGHGRGF